MKYVVAITFVCVAIVSFKAGELSGVIEARAALREQREAHNLFMRELGICEWADAVAIETECQEP